MKVLGLLKSHWRDLDGYHPPDQITFASLIDYVGHHMPRDHPELPLPVYSGIGMGGTVILRRIGGEGEGE